MAMKVDAAREIARRMLAVPLPRRWSHVQAVAAKAGTFHSLRRFFATTLMSNGFEPQDVQKALRHANLRITLETYVHWLPKKDRPRGVVGQLLRQAEGNRTRSATGQDRS
ncbi:tyrosine-type recombinase/integrase [Melissospora conviva]|uniref:tyrosine-type recombinase/integrase n=1 Tax=Melissospora conviva TaxID=3388432 RepID=UPI003C25C145